MHCAPNCGWRRAASTTPTQIDKTVEDLTIDIAKRGYPFAVVRPRGERNFEAHRVDLVFLIEEGPHTYVERINIRGNTRTRDYVIPAGIRYCRRRCL